MDGADSIGAVVSDGSGGTTIRTLRPPKLGPRDVRVRSLVSGISTGTDRWVLQGRFVWVDIRYPAIPGYQMAGIVEALGADVADLHEGQAVAVTRGQPIDAIASAWGTHASVVVADRAEVYDATGIPAARAAFLVVAQVGFNAASRLQLDPGSPVLVVGDGIVGASAAMAAAARGFDVAIMGRHAERLATLRQHGFLTIDAHESEESIRMHAPVAVIDTAQNEEAFAAYVTVLPPRTGQIVYSGHSPGGVTAWADMALLQKRELSVHFVSGMKPDRLTATLSLMRDGRMATDVMVGALAQDEHSTLEVFDQVAGGALGPIAAAIDWSWAR